MKTTTNNMPYLIHADTPETLLTTETESLISWCSVGAPIKRGNPSPWLLLVAVPLSFYYSPIHDHSNAHCLVKVLDGAITETQYNWPDLSPEGFKDSAINIPNVSSDTCPLKLKSVNTFGQNLVTYMHGKTLL
jgi:Cysteine dioxygenase type I